MRRTFASCLTLALLGPTAVWAQETATCGSRQDRLGVSRTIEIDTKSGPLFGRQQYKDHDLLKDKEVVLTFDDGPVSIYTKPILEALQAHCTRATFFMVGRMALANPALVRQVAAQGHTIGTHTWSHQNLHSRSGDGGKREIELGVSAVSKAMGRPIAPFFRFPYLADPKRMIAYIQERDIAVFSIDVDSKDYRTGSGDTVVRKVMRDLDRQGKGIILMHDIQRSTARGLPRLLDELKRGGYKVVHIVAKSEVTTRKAYDEDAAELLKANQAALRDQPLASRSMVWPAEKPAKKRRKVRQWSKPAENSKPPSAPDNNWRRRVFSDG